jgi:hypothetical protein
VKIILRAAPGEDYRAFNMIGTLKKDAEGFYRVLDERSGAIKFQLADVAQVQTAGKYPRIYLRSNFL